MNRSVLRLPISLVRLREPVRAGFSDSRRCSAGQLPFPHGDGGRDSLVAAKLATTVAAKIAFTTFAALVS